MAEPKAPESKAATRPNLQPPTPAELAAQERAQHSTLEEALAAFQAEIPTVHKGKTAKVEKDGRTLYSYAYADLGDVAAEAYPALTKHGLSFTTRPTWLEGAGFVLEGVLRHISGQEDVGCLPIQGRDAQAIGSSLTYNRRYLLGCMTGIVTEEDDDGSRAAQARTERPQADQTQGRQRSPEDATPTHVQAARRLIEGATDPERAKIRAWWENAASQGQLPPPDKLDAMTPPQVAWLEETVAGIREAASQEAQPPLDPQ